MKFASAFLVLGAAFPAGVSSFVAPSTSNTLTTTAQTRTTITLSSSSLRSSTTEDNAVTETNNAATSIIEGMPSHSPATSLPNQVYNWRGQNIRYQVSGPEDADHTLLLIHGLFVNSDHWRKMLTGLQNSDDSGKTYRVYALDLLGSGWSSKPFRDDPTAQSINGENGRFVDCDSTCYREQQQSTSSSSATKSNLRKIRSAPILENVPLGTAAGGNRLATSLELRHPLKSPYNFYTWGEQIADFTHDVIHNDNNKDSGENSKVTLVANSIGTMSALQSILDEPTLYDGCFVINPNFRELHMAEVPLSPLAMPLVRQIQSLLRTKGHGLFESLATPEIVTEILKEPYAVTDAIDEELVEVLLNPLLTKGADEVVFDTLSYSAGPLPEQQLSDSAFPGDVPVWVVYGEDDPWTPSGRVENLAKVCNNGDGPVERVLGLEGAGHCPHDEVPERVNELLSQFLDRLDGTN